MGSHGLISGTRSISRILAGIQKTGEFGSHGLRNLVLQKPGSDSLLVEILHLHIHLVGDESQQSLVQFLIESCIKILLEVLVSLCQSLAGLSGRASRPGADDVGPAGSRASHDEPQGSCGKNNQNHYNPVTGGSEKEAASPGQ